MANQRGIVSGWDTGAERPKGVTTPGDMRASLGALSRSEGIVLEAGAADITRSTVAMSISWTAFTAVISSPLGGWLSPRIGAASQTLQPGDTTYSRKDIIWVRHHDYERDASHPDSEVEVGYTTGTPSAMPLDPSIPVGALAVFTIQVPRGAMRGSDISAVLIRRARWTTPVGGVLTAPSDFDAKNLVQGVRASADAPIYVWRSDLGALTVWDGVSWKSQSLVLGSYQFSGDSPFNAPVPAPGANFLFKTGYQSGATQISGSVGYLQWVSFDTPFPKDCLVVMCQPLYYVGGQYSFSDATPVMVDRKDRTGFRAVCVGERASHPHSIGWLAIGH